MCTCSYNIIWLCVEQPILCVIQEDKFQDEAQALQEKVIKTIMCMYMHMYTVYVHPVG